MEEKSVLFLARSDFISTYVQEEGMIRFERGTSNMLTEGRNDEMTGGREDWREGQIWDALLYIKVAAAAIMLGFDIFVEYRFLSLNINLVNSKL